MKYTLDLLPLRAFQGRGTPVGGRSLRLFGGGGYVSGDYVDTSYGADGLGGWNAAPEPVPDGGGGWTAPAEAAPAPAEAAPAPAAPAPAPAEAAPAPAAPAPAAVVSDPVRAPLAPVNQWEQTVNDIYQQTFGRQADAGGMASFTAALNAGMTGEQMRAALASSAEGQSYGLSPVAPLTAAAQAPQWELQPESYDEFTGTYNAPYYIDVNSGDRKEVGQPVQYTGVTPVDPNTLAQHVGPNFQGTPTQFYDEQGNLKGILVDAVRAGLNTREGELILDPMSLGLALKPNETASLNSQIQQRNEQGQLLFIDPNTGGTTIYNTGVPAETGSTVKDLLYINERKYGGQIPADTAQAALMFAAALATGGAGGALLEGLGLGAGAAGAGLTATEAAALMGGTLSEAGAAATMGGQLASQGINWGAAATAAAKTAAINAAVTAAQGGNIGDVLKAGALGAVTGGAGVAGAGLLGGGALAQIGTQTAIATAIAAARGQDPLQAALSGAITATLSSVIPAGTADVLNGAGITDPSIQKAINSAISSSVVAAVRGGDVGTAAIMGAVNSALTSVAGMIGNSQVVQDIKANITNALTSTIDSVKYEIGATNAQALPIEGSNRSPVGTELPTQAPYDADAELDRVIQNLPSSASGVEYTPAALSNVVTPPLIQQATGQADADAIYNQLVANAANSTVGAPVSTLAGATTSDVNPPTLSSGDDYIYYRDAQGNEVYGPRSMAPTNEPETTSSEPPAGSFLGEYGDLAPAQSRLATFGQGVASALDNTVGAIIPSVAQMASYLGLRTGDQIAQLTASMIGKDYQANPELMREISNRVAEALSNPVGKAFGVTNTSGYTSEASGQALRFISENLDKGADYLSKKTGLPAGDIRLITDSILMRPGTALSTIREAGTAVKDVGRGFADSATNVINEGPAGGAYNLGATVADLTRAPDTSLMRGENNARNINLGEIIDEAPSYVSPERLSAPAPALGYSPTEVVAPSRDVASIFNDAFEAADRIPTYDVPAVSRAEPATQLAPESRGALPTTFAEPTIKPIDLGPNLTQNSLTDITAQAKVVDQNLGSRTEPQRQAQESLIDTTVKTYAPEGTKPSVINFWNKTFTEGAYSGDVIDGIKNTFENESAPPEVILDQVDKATDPLNADEQLPAKLKMLSNASKLGITPAEAIKLGLLNNNGTKTELGEKVSPTPQPQPKPQPKPYPDPVAPLTPVKPVLPPNPPPPAVYPPPSVNPPIPTPPSVNPPIDVAPPININPPIIKPPPLVQAAITPPTAAPKASAPSAAMTPSYMYAGAQGSGPGALPGNLQSTFLQGVNVNEYNPFENYNVYQQLGSPAPVRAAQGGSPLQLAQMQQSVSGVDPRLYSVLQKRQAPNYFTYGQDASGGNPTTFAGSQLMGKPTPGIPVIPTGQKAAADWLYQGSGTNPLAMAGTGIANLPTGMMAEGGQAHGGEDEHIPEFITGATGHYVRGRGDGQSDDIPAMLADGEYVFDASTVSTLGNGSSDAGAKLLDAFRESLRDHTRSAPADKIPPKASPLEYMKEALQNVGRK